MVSQAAEANADIGAADRRFTCQSVPPSTSVPGLLDDVRSGLLERPRTLPPKYFYDARGSELFDRICDTPEYYPTRVESTLLQDGADELLGIAAPEYLIELGSGTSRKTRLLLDACPALSLEPEYRPMDVCEPMLIDSGEALIGEYPWLSVNALVGDYHGGFGHFPPAPGRALYVFLGGTIGNFEHDEAVALLGEVCGLMRDDDHLLLGMDRAKDSRILEAAYNDEQGMTAAFNLNVLDVLNRDVQADFNPARFAHRALYNRDQKQIEMYLIAESDQAVHIGALQQTIQIEAGERIRTEISRKFTPEAIEHLLAEAGLAVVHHRQADEDYYSLVLARPRR